MLPEKTLREDTVAVVSICLSFHPSIHPSIYMSSYLLNLSSEIDVVDKIHVNVPLDKGLWTKVSQDHIGKFKVTQSI
jgi:hypothetical protein